MRVGKMKTLKSGRKAPLPFFSHFFLFWKGMGREIIWPHPVLIGDVARKKKRSKLRIEKKSNDDGDDNDETWGLERSIVRDDTVCD